MGEPVPEAEWSNFPPAFLSRPERENGQEIVVSWNVRSACPSQATADKSDNHRHASRSAGAITKAAKLWEPSLSEQPLKGLSLENI